MRTAFVTGGSGFVGRALLRRLTANGVEVRALARSAVAARAVRELGAVPVEGGLFDVDVMRRAMAKADAVFHLAAVVTDWGDEAKLRQVHVEGTRSVLRAAIEAGVPRFVHVSTEAVLASRTPIVGATESWPLPKCPAGAYPRTKGEAETVVLAEYENIDPIVVRPRLVWGEGDTSFLPLLVEAVRAGRFVWVAGGRYPTHTCHVKNAALGIVRAAERGVPGGVYFLTDGEPVEMRTFLTRLLASQGVVPPNRSLPRWLVKEVAFAGEWMWRRFKLAGQPPITATAYCVLGQPVTVSDARARRELGYAEVVTVDEGLAELASR